MVGAPNTVPFNDPSVSPVRGTPPGQTAFLGPEPARLPEVTVSAKRPPVVAPPRTQLTPGAFASMLRRLMSPWFALLYQQPANVGEDERVRDLIMADLASRLLPVNPSVTRLAEPLATVTVRSTRISDRPAARAPASLYGGTLGDPRLRTIRTPFFSPVPSFTRPTPQRLPVRSRITAGLSPSTSPVVGPLVEILPRVDPRPRPRPPGTITITPVVTPPGIGTPPPRVQVPLPRVPTVIDPLTGFQPVGVPSLLTQPQPQRTRDGRCVCPKPVKERERRKRLPRLECWRGTYTETSGGLIKSRKEKVPCR